MQRYMTHPQHGYMPVYSQSEIDYNQKSGWKLETGNKAESTPTVEGESLIEAGQTTEKENEKNTCPKCGKSFTRGLTMHMKFCQPETT